MANNVLLCIFILIAMITGFITNSSFHNHKSPMTSHASITPSTPSLCLWESFNALTLATKDMGESVSFYKKLGLSVSFGGPDAPFTTLSPLGDSSQRESLYINLFYSEEYEPPNEKGGWNGWGRCVVHVSNVDAIYEIAVEEGLEPQFSPRDASWGERYFHLRDPMGHELSFAKRLEDHKRWQRSRE